MKKYFLGTLIIIVTAIAILLIAASTRPKTFFVERSITIKASPDKIASFINDFHQWNSWSPYEKIDPNMKKRFSGNPSGLGAVYEWEGNSNAGTGRMEIVDTMLTRITIKLDFLKPFEGHNTAEFLIDSDDGKVTKVTWEMFGPSPFISKVIGIFFNMDAMIGKDFEKGLASLKSISES